MEKTNKLPTWRRKLSVRILERSKQLYHTITGSETDRLLFIFGCQRSGTTTLQRIFEQDWNTKIFSEVGSALSKRDTKLGLRLDPIDELQVEFANHKAPLIIAKPLVESQNARQLLASFPGSKAIWMYRHYADVAASKVKKSGKMSGVGDLRYIVNNTENDWRSDRVPLHIRELVQRYFSEAMNGLDAAALYWYVRNNFFFDQALDDHPGVILCCYDDLVGDSVRTVRRIYDFLERPFPGESVLVDVHAKSIGKGRHIEVAPEIETLCDEMLERLTTTDQRAQQQTRGG